MNSTLQNSPRKEQAATTRQKLINTTRLLFSENGYKGTSMRAISRNAGLSDGLLYHYFPGGKKEIFQVIVTENLGQILAKSLELSKQQDCNEIPVDILLRQGILHFTDIINSNIDILRIIVRESEVREFLSKEELVKLTDNAYNHFFMLLKRRMEKGEIRSINCEEAAFIIKSLMVNYILIKVLDADTCNDCTPERYADIICNQAALWKISMP